MPTMLKKAFVSVSLAVLCVGATGCYKTTIKNGGAAAAPATVENSEKWSHGLILGVVELNPTDLKAACPNGWAEVDTQTSFLNGLVAGLLNNIYTPQTATIRCKAGGTAPAAAPAK